MRTRRVYRGNSRNPESLSQAPSRFVRVDDEDLPRITPAHLRRAGDMCRRRLAREVNGGKRGGNHAGDMRFAVSNRIEGDARLAQSELGPPRPEAFVEPLELEPEQRALYRAARQGYLDAFGTTRARITEPEWRTALPELGAELSSNLGLRAELDDGGRELRKVLVGARHDAKLLDPVDVRVALIRTAEWAPVQLDIVAVDVIEQRRTTYTPDLDAERAEAHEWIAERVALVLELSADARPQAGRDCQGCAFISGCTKHPG
jgi:hypothetical protein